MKRFYKVKPVEFKIGQQVLLKKETFQPWQKALEPKWEGPFVINKVYNNGTYLLKGQTKAVNGDRLKEYKDQIYQEPIVIIEN